MKRIVKLTEDDLTRIVRRVLSEQPTSPSTGTLPWLPSKPQASATSKPQAPPKTPFFNICMCIKIFGPIPSKTWFITII